ncbi:LOW QUALITY PROTEIN: atrial natriuretic peptide receptor 1-like [Pecten maximus]|uniref:LOW QUALITY PROTEIN: atrial natriuretic peptide receptor 1-like n=1 Tax=Pecten maximus TaxID=6579 RepID=UPI001459011F|nr:LOW QUALITY PROTEIN: atrial natriuretic peptide receptor 1-like [Pecten maximus]
MNILLFIMTVPLVICRGAEFRLGMLSPFTHPRLGWTNNAAAATIAIETAQSEGILSDHNITVVWKDDKCSGLGGAGNAVLLRDVDDVDVYIGPPCSSSTEPVGLLASFWNFPILSQASSDPILADKSVYKTLVRLGPPFNKLGNAMVEFLEYFQWRRIVVISRRKTDNKKVFCDYSSRSYETPFRVNNITIADMITIDDGITEEEIDELLTRVQQRGRIVILCSENLEDKRLILVRAYQKGMMNGEYVYITPDHLPPSNVETPWKRGDGLDDIAKESFKSVFQITVSDMGSEEVEQFRKNVSINMANPPWNYNETLASGTRGSEYSPFLHDVVYLYMLILNETVTEGSDHRNGTLVFNKAKGKAFKGITGNVKVDSNGDREPDYWIWYMTDTASRFEVVLEAEMTSSETQKIRVLKTQKWNTLDGRPPRDSPICGFFGELCPESTRGTSAYIIAGVVTVLLAVTGLGLGLFFYRRARYEKQLELQLWKVDYDEIRVTKSRAIGSISQLSLNTITSANVCSSHHSDTSVGVDQQVFSKIGTYKHTVVTIRSLSHKKVINLERQDLMELKAMWDLRQENVNAFVGVCLDERGPCLLTGYCNKGSLQDIIENDDIKLDWMFKLSLISDMIAGIQYIHNSPLKVHGNLKSSNCVVDNRWVLKITDFGVLRLRSLFGQGAPSTYQVYSRQFWTAPELLRLSENQCHSSQKGDVFSVGVILFEILYRSQPYDTVSYTPQEIIERVRTTENPPFRPHVAFNDDINTNNTNDAPTEVTQIMTSCYEEDPEDRPSFSTIKSYISKLNKGRRTNIVDNMISMLEKYANNLEHVVEQRTYALLEEKKKTDSLLYRMLPRVVAERLKSGENICPEIFESVTIFFSDIVGFTSLSSSSTPIEVVDFLNDLYTSFDTVIAMYDVYKVETIGDAYMVASGLPVRNGNMHSKEIANMALALLDSVDTFKIKHRPDKKLQLRIGLHTGPCAAGVVGRTMPRYCLFGDTVNMASRMESNGEALKIHVSNSTYNCLSKHIGYDLQERGSMEIKGKGMQTTYWLIGMTCAAMSTVSSPLYDVKM